MSISTSMSISLSFAVFSSVPAFASMSVSMSISTHSYLHSYLYLHPYLYLYLYHPVSFSTRFLDLRVLVLALKVVWLASYSESDVNFDFFRLLRVAKLARALRMCLR